MSVQDLVSPKLMGTGSVTLGKTLSVWGLSFYFLCEL